MTGRHKRLQKMHVLSTLNIYAASNKNKTVVGIGDMHFSQHRLKKVRSRYGVNNVFTLANKLRKLCAAM